MVYRGALTVPWPCEPDGRSTVPDQDRAQVDRVSQALQVLFEPETETSHLIQALLESVPPRDIYKLHKATLDSIPCDPEGGETLRPAPIPDTTGTRPPTGYGQAPNTHVGPPDISQLPKDPKPQPRNKSPRDTPPPPLSQPPQTQPPDTQATQLRATDTQPKPTQPEPTTAQHKAAPEVLQTQARQELQKRQDLVDRKDLPNIAFRLRSQPSTSKALSLGPGPAQASTTVTGARSCHCAPKTARKAGDAQRPRDRHPGLSEDLTPGTPDIQTWPVMSLRRLERRSGYPSHKCTDCHKKSPLAIDNEDP